MAIRYYGGTARLYTKDIDKPVADARYQMMMTQGTRFTTSKWWGDFSTGKELRTLGDFVIEFEDGSRGDIVVYSCGASSAKGSRFQYTFNGRGKLSGPRGRGLANEF